MCEFFVIFHGVFFSFSSFFFFFLRFYSFIFREWVRERRDTTMCGCLSLATYWGPGPQPRHVPRLGIEPATPQFAGQHSTHWATAARAFLRL